MTRLPLENRDVKGLEGPQFPRFKVGPMCSMPLCSRIADSSHHLFRRSFIGGDYCWVRLPNGSIVGNLSAMCWRCHALLTENKARIIWNYESRLFEWVNDSGEIIAPLNPQPPIHGEKPKENSVTSNTAVGPAGKERCTECGRVLPHEHDAKKEPKRRRKTYVIQVPSDMEEDGALSLDILVDGCRELFSHDENPNTRFYTIAMALSLVLQHGDRMMSDE